MKFMFNFRQKTIKTMKIPKTTKEEPYIQFSFSKKGKLSFEITSNWWGGINGGFISSDGYSGNTCLPKDLEKYIKRYKLKQIKEIDDEIKELNKKKEVLIKKFEFSAK